MPMMKTLSSGTTSITKVRSYLLREQRKDYEATKAELDLYENGDIYLPDKQVGYLKDYLTGHSRGLAVDVSDDLSEDNWAVQMDLTRDRYGHFLPTKQGVPRTYYHFMLSPSPEDECSLTTLRLFAIAWAEFNFRNAAKETEHEFAIVYHNDGTNGVLHAHIVVNVSNKATGKKLHLDNDEVVALANSAQEIGKKYGLTPMPKLERVGAARTSQPIFYSKEELELIEKGKPSWKQELRDVILATAPVSSDFEDFSSRLSRKGYGVSQSKKTGNLTYTHQNQQRVRDTKLGALFYIESLEQMFNQERSAEIEERKYADWELTQLAQGKVPWKEDIRRAIDAVVPNVLSFPELIYELEHRYNIHVIINRRGITYQHPNGRKTRDINIGFRYTLDGLRANAIVGEVSEYPKYDAVLSMSARFVKHYHPHSAPLAHDDASKLTASMLAYRDMDNLLRNNNLSSLNSVEGFLEGQREKLSEIKDELMRFQGDLRKWNRLAGLQERLEDCQVYVKDTKNKDKNPELYDIECQRYNQLSAYLNEKAEGVDIYATKRAFSKAYEKYLDAFNAHLNAFERDSTVYRNYLQASKVNFQYHGEALTVGVEELAAAMRTLDAYKIQNFTNLEVEVSSLQNKLDSLTSEIKSVEAQKNELYDVITDITIYSEMKIYEIISEPLKGKEASLGIDTEAARYQEAKKRLENKGIPEDDFDFYHAQFKQAQTHCRELCEEKERLQESIWELQGAKDMCQKVSESIREHSLEALLDGRIRKSGNNEVDKVTEVHSIEVDAPEKQPEQQFDSSTPLDVLKAEAGRRAAKKNAARLEQKEQTEQTEQGKQSDTPKRGKNKDHDPDR